MSHFSSRSFIQIIAIYFLCISCNSTDNEPVEVENDTTHSNVQLIILGTIQDAGSPHIACSKSCCIDLFDSPDETRKVVSLGLVDRISDRTYLFEATPDMPSQMKLLKKTAESKSELADGIFLTHAHIGHYSGLMYLGKEATNAKRVQTFSMPRMKAFLENNGPWSQLVLNANIDIIPIQEDSIWNLTKDISVEAFKVPHRDEYSETVGYKIYGPQKSVLFIPDIDKWEKWEESIIEQIREVDYAFLDATFYDAQEINNRDISLIPHPFVIESIEKFGILDSAEKAKIHFIHFNHTNPLINLDSPQARSVLDAGFKIARYKQHFRL